ncbi:xanthine dehydrogenase family protein subunit M [Tateyamaria sp. ANG-S1]|uniref:FAD binding domain-containing protein n=1 Tax=Tateyamaria sp. ANG-S1 TaxID=1577905 RepID=UPI00057D0866|nr:xanthine dehydrogenase family protein subunit M [Tateyamaria sp. ANG-S1]KIC48372.1 FAD-binding molybdopterin dehydrogenase [Tateyamaria sp. ANG-S1]
MREFALIRAETADAAIAALTAHPNARLIAGGTNLVDLMKEGVETPTHLIDINGLGGLDDVQARGNGGLMIGALASNSAVAWHSDVQVRFPMMSEAILAGATTQLRNMATMGGNLLQKNRCFYYANHAARCNKRAPGSGCDAMDGVNRMCAVLGTSDHCIAAHPSDVCVALRALDAVVHVTGVNGHRAIDFADFHKRPGDTPHVEFELAHDELILGIEVPGLPFAANSTYLKLRDRTSYAFALVSIAAALKLEGDTVDDVRLAVGSVGTVPWRSADAEDAMRGAPATAETFAKAADIFFEGAIPRAGNGFKIELAKRAIVRVMETLKERAI